jgi:hypothetical protein
MFTKSEKTIARIALYVGVFAAGVLGERYYESYANKLVVDSYRQYLVPLEKRKEQIYSENENLMKKTKIVSLGYDRDTSGVHQKVLDLKREDDSIDGVIMKKKAIMFEVMCEKLTGEQLY